jgi:hypothetical protein
MVLLLNLNSSSPNYSMLLRVCKPIDSGLSMRMLVSIRPARLYSKSIQLNICAYMHSNNVT